MDRFSDEAVVLSTVDYGEADRIVTLFTRDHGRLSAFAAGARKSKRRFAGALDVGTRLTAHLVSTRGDTLRLDGADGVGALQRTREDLALLARALYCLELCRELTADHQPHPPLFEMLIAYLEQLESRRAGPTSLLKFELDALEHAGLRPQFSSCVRCQLALGEQPRFAPSHGGVVCTSCAVDGFPTAPDVARALARLQAGERLPLETGHRAHGRKLLSLFIEHHVGRPLKSARFLEQVGAD